MNIKRLPCLSFVLGSVLLSGTLTAQAQNQSDITGANVTSSGITSGAFTPTSSGTSSGSSSGSTITKFAAPSAVLSVNNAAGSVNTQLAQGNLPVVAAGVPTTSIPANVQQGLQSVLTQTGNVAANSQQIVNALSNTSKATKANTSGATNTTLAQKLVSSLKGLTAGGKVSPPKLAAAVTAYNALIDASSNEFLTNPPPELLAIQSALSTLDNAALTAK